jgi:hypothetical protein
MFVLKEPNVDTDFLGHGTFAEKRTLLNDMFAVINHGHNPGARFGLKACSTTQGAYWSFAR